MERNGDTAGRLNIPYFRPSIGPEEHEAVHAVLSSGWLTSGSRVKEFEAGFARYLGVRHAVAVNSCTAALHLALEAAGVGRGDLVLVPTMTFAATAAAVQYLGARPVLVDCDSQTLCMDPNAAEEALRTWLDRGNLKAIVAVHYGGQMADVKRLRELADRRHMTLIEDAAHALPAYTRDAGNEPWRMVGTTAALTCFSFYANKCITCGEGGMVVTHDPDVAARVRMMSLHGLSKSAWKRFEASASCYYEIQDLGYKYNLTDMAAAVGLAQLGNAEKFWHLRRRVARLYNQRLGPYQEFIELPTEHPDRRSAWHLYPIRLHLDRLRIDRTRFLAELDEAGVGSSVHWMPLHLHPFYEQTYGYRPDDYPVAAEVWPRLVSLPIFPAMHEQEVDYVCNTIGAIVKRHAAVGYTVPAGWDATNKHVVHALSEADLRAHDEPGGSSYHDAFVG